MSPWMARALALSLLLTWAASPARADFTVTGVSAPFPDYPVDNPFYYANLASIGTPPVQTGVDNRDLFGGEFGTLEGGGRFVFDDANAQPERVDFVTKAPVTISGFSIILAEDTVDRPSRSTASLSLIADGVTVASGLIVSPGQDYLGAYGSDTVLVTASFAPVTATRFTALFTANTGKYAGPRAFDFVAIRAVPEPASLALLAMGGLGLAVGSRRRSGRR